MNAREYKFDEMSVEGRQIEEVVASIFHTLLFHRTTGKIIYKEKGSYSIGTIGVTDVDCDYIDFTYVRVSSNEMDKVLREKISEFMEAMRNVDDSSGQISLAFYQKKKHTSWFITPECSNWEIWTVKLNVIDLANEHESQVYMEKVVENLADKILYITDVMNKNYYTPEIPQQSDVDMVFNTSFSDVQPYLFQITYSTAGPSNPSVGTTMRKLLKDTLTL